MLTEYKTAILRALTIRPRPAQEFTNGTLASLQLAPVHVMRYLERMTEVGLLSFDGHRYSITPEGREVLTEVVPTAPVRSFVNATMREPYRLPQWQVRAGADAHQQCKSRGIGA